MKALKELIKSVKSESECKEYFVDNYSAYTVERVYDLHPLNPRLEEDQLGHLVTWHDRYILGEVNTDLSPEEFLQSLPSDAIVLNVYMMEHSAIALSCDPFNDRWDSGLVGFIYTTIEEALKWGYTSLDEVLKELRGEIESFNDFINTSYYGIIITDIYTTEVISNCFNLTEDDIEDYLTDFFG